MEEFTKMIDRLTNEMVDKIHDRLKTEVVDRIRIPGGFFTKVLVLLVLVAAIWMFRYEITPTGDPNGMGDVYILDRWKGEIRAVIQNRSFEVLPIEKGK
jgi:hypothetical protein